AEFTDAKVNDLYHGARWEDTPADDEEIELQVPGLRLATA
ncbi:MAG TPA: phosphonate ABC transporter, partial [Limnobacter sp.]|nr:phosphonate ABC transporter [Limnobacter sp.]